MCGSAVPCCPVHGGAVTKMVREGTQEDLRGKSTPGPGNTRKMGGLQDDGSRYLEC